MPLLNCVAKLPACVVLYLLSISAAAQGADVKVYPIKFERPLVAGQNYALSISDTTRSLKTVMTGDVQSNRTESFRRVQLNADVAVEQVDEKGNHTAMVMKVRELTLQNTAGSTSSTPRRVLPAGTEVKVTYEGGKASFTAAGTDTLTGDAVEALSQIFRARVSQKSDDDDRYGSKEPRKIGERWGINVDALIEDKTATQSIDPSQTRGSVTLRDVRTTGGTETALVDVTIFATLVGTGAKEYTMEIALNASLPTDVKKSMMTKTVKSKTHVVSETETLAGVKRRETVDVELVHEVSWVPR